MSLKRIILLIIAGIFVFLAVICHLIAFFSDYWLKSSSIASSDFLNLGLWDACFHDYLHDHEFPAQSYDGCHPINSDYYKNILPWLQPGNNFLINFKNYKDQFIYFIYYIVI